MSYCWEIRVRAARLVNFKGRDIAAAMKEARAAGLSEGHVLDVEQLAACRPALVLTQDTCPACDVPNGTVHAALEAAGLGRGT